ncbi:hypothetical protein [Streptomyces galbus]|uniref:Uncharacterized protein n=1 Tax=Streptomyces galbus TaxID=33898 RepID=A0A4U5WW19_STRGB|nr:hypothetical protein [Streptomyces galbus]TKT06694.1 hypothetical protein E4U92_25760 [Streptomyces galbus]GHD48968.1 hypothetical protein GCM10010335_58150 [Streptomyces galbus]
MSDGATLIDPSGIPHFIGDLSTLDVDVMLLTANAAQFRASGADIHTTFQGLGAVYHAPEAGDLLSSTEPVRAKSDAFADDLEKVVSALSEYSAEVQPLVDRLETLKADATAFVASVSGDEDWRKDQDKVDRNNALWREVNHAVAAFQAAERRAYNKIMGLIGGQKLTVDDGSHGDSMYGYRADDLDHARQTPWGAPAEREYEGWGWLRHEAGQVWEGIWTDGVIGTIHGVGTLFGSDGSHAAGEAWKNLAKLGTASALTSATFGTWWLVPADRQPAWLRESREAHKGMVKGLVAWDTWQTNPARAAGAVTFNVLTVLGTEGAGSAASGAARTGAAARTLSVVGKVGRAIDPMTYAGKAGKFAFVKVGDAFSKLKDLRTGATYALPDAPLAERPPAIPEHAAELVDDAGHRVYLDTRTGDVLNADGTIRQHAGEAAHEPSAHDRSTLGAAANDAQQPVGVGARSAGANGAADAGTHGQSVGGHTGSGGPGSPHSAGHDPLEPREIMRQQVERANNDPQWFREHYRSNGYRRSTSSSGGFGQELPQLVPDPDNPSQWILKDDLPPPVAERYLHNDPVTGQRSAVNHDILHHLDGQAAKRNEAIALDQAAEKKMEAAEKAYAVHRTDELAEAMQRADAEHSPLHADMNRQSELFGETVAEQHAVPEHYPDAVRVDDGAFGNNRFDQIYRRPGGRYVVVEAKGSLRARLGVRKGLDGRMVTQGSREYFETILYEMQQRAERYEDRGMFDEADAERQLADDLGTALDQGKVDYVLVKADAHGAQYAGYRMKQFDITN